MQSLAIGCSLRLFLSSKQILCHWLTAKRVWIIDESCKTRKKCLSQFTLLDKSRVVRISFAFYCKEVCCPLTTSVPYFISRPQKQAASQLHSMCAYRFVIKLPSTLTSTYKQLLLRDEPKQQDNPPLAA